MEPTNTMAYYQELRPNLWQRLCLWRGWPWATKPVPHEERTWGAQPYLVMVRENDVLIGWHPIDTADGATTVLVPSRWAALASVFSPRRYEVSIGRDPEWGEAHGS